MKIKDIPLNSELDKTYIDFINLHRAHPTNLDSYHWQFSYLPKQSVITGLVEDDKVLGTQCMMPIEVVTPQGEIISGKCENSYLDKSLRGKNQFSKLFEYAREDCKKKGLKMLWAFTPAIKPYSRLGFKVYHHALLSSLLYINYPSLGKILASKKGLSLLKGVAAYLFLLLTVSLLKIKLLARKPFSKNDGYSIMEHEKKAGDIERLNEKIRESYPRYIQLKHSEKYLNWRVVNNPNQEFSQRFYYDNDELIAYCQYYLDHGFISLGNLLWHDEKYLETVVFELISHLQSTGEKGLIYHGNFENDLNARIFGLFEKLSLRKTHRQGQHFVYYFSEFEEQPEIDHANWFINNLWTEGY